MACADGQRILLYMGRSIPLDDEKWRAVQPGDEVSSAGGDLVGLVVAVRPDSLVVRDPLEGRQLLIPRDAVAGRRGLRLCLRPRPAHAAGGGPERYARHPNLDDDWVAEQATLGAALTVEGDGPTDWRRLTPDGEPAPADED